MLMTRSPVQIVGVGVAIPASRRYPKCSGLRGRAMFKYLWAAMTALGLVAIAPAAMAQCVVMSPNTIECHGNSDGYTVVGAPGAATFIIKNGTTGAITLHSAGGSDVLDFSDFTGPVSVDVTASGLSLIHI